jgi:hypothetical protein
MRCDSAVSDGRALVRAAVIAAAALLVLGLTATPAFGQDGGGDGAQYDAVCQNIIGAISVAQTQSGGANATAVSGGGADGNGEGSANGGGSARAVAQVAQAQGVSVAQVNECLNRAADRPDVKAATVDDQDKGDVLAATIPKKPLPFTGGIPLLGLFAVIGLAAIVAGVFVLRAVMSRRS